MHRPVVCKDTKQKTFRLQLLMGRSESDSSWRLGLPWNFLMHQGCRDQTAEFTTSVWAQADCFRFPAILYRNGFPPVSPMGLGLFGVVLNSLLLLQNNRLTKIEGLQSLVNLRELYLSHNGIEVIEGLENNVSRLLLTVQHNCCPKLLVLVVFLEVFVPWFPQLRVGS